MRRRNNGSSCFCQTSAKRIGRGGCNETETNEPPGWCIYVAVALVAIGCYLNALDCDFVHDDIPAVVRNRDVIGEASWSSVLNDDFWGTPMESINSHKSYRPFTTLTFRLNYLMAGLSPMWYHATNVALHAAACILVTRVSLVVAALRPGFAALAGLLFAAHPVHTEAVTGIVGRADVLACIFFLLSFLAYHGQQTAYVWSSVCLGALSMLAKETGVTVLALNLLYDLCRSWHSIKRSIYEAKWNDDSRYFSRRAAALLVSFGILLVVRLALLHGTLPNFSAQDNPAAFHPCFHVRLLTFCYLAALNCWLLLCPAILSHDWQMGSVPLITSFTDTRNLATCIFFGGCLILTYKAFTDFEQQRHPPLVLGWMFLVLPFLPASNLFVTVGFVVAERVLYTPSVGWIILIVYGMQVSWAAVPRRRSWITRGVVLLLVLGCFRTVLRNNDWTSRETLIKAGLRSLPYNAKMHYNFANFLKDTSQPNLAVHHYQLALKLWPGYASAHNNLGTLTIDDQAEYHFKAAINAQPGHVNAHYNLGRLYRRTNRTEQCIEMLRRCVSLDPAYAPAFRVLARIATGPATGDLLKHVIHLQPRNPDALAEYAYWLYKNGKWLPSLQCYFKAMEIFPSHKPSLIGALRILRSRGQWSRVHQLIFRYIGHVVAAACGYLPAGRTIDRKRFQTEPTCSETCEIAKSHRDYNRFGPAERQRCRWAGSIWALIADEGWHLMLRARRGGFIYRGDLYMRAWELQSESRQRAHQHQRNLCISENGCSRPRVASVSVQLEQDSNKSEQLQRAPRCNVRTCRQPRKGKARVTAPTLLVQNFLETL